MFPSAADPRRAARPRTLLWPSVWAISLVTAVVLAPFPLASAWSGGAYSSRAALVDSLNAGFVQHWAAGVGALGPDLAGPVTFWARFHVVKAALAAVLLLVLLILGSRTRLSYSRAATTRRRLAVGAVAAVDAPLAVLALLVVVANVQGAIAPLSSALGLLPLDRPDPRLADTLAQVRSGLAGDSRGPVLTGLVHDFAVYHEAMVALGATVTVGLSAAAVLLWRRTRRAAGTAGRRRVLTAVVVAVVALSAFFALVTAANVSTVAHPAPALLGFFASGS